jgi:hypothetical protein
MRSGIGVGSGIVASDGASQAAEVELPAFAVVIALVVAGLTGQAGTGTTVLFRHYGFADGYGEMDLAHTAQTWAMILQRLAGYLADGRPQPFFPAPVA